jgi:hypothetical protein
MYRITVALVAVQLVRLAVARVERRRDVLARIQVAAHEQVQQTVVVVVGPRRHRRAAVRADPRSLRHVGERAVPVVSEKLVRTECSADKQVFVSVVVVVGEHPDAHTVQSA